MLPSAFAPVHLAVFLAAAIQVADVRHPGAEGCLLIEPQRLSVGDVVAEVAFEFVEVFGEEDAPVGIDTAHL